MFLLSSVIVVFELILFDSGGLPPEEAFGTGGRQIVSSLCLLVRCVQTLLLEWWTVMALLQSFSVRSQADCKYARGPRELKHAPDLRKTKLCFISWKDAACGVPRVLLLKAVKTHPIAESRSRVQRSLLLAGLLSWIVSELQGRTCRQIMRLPSLIPRLGLFR